MKFDLQEYNMRSKSSYGKGEVLVRNGNNALSAMKSGKLISGTSKDEIQRNVNKCAATVIDETSQFLRDNKTELVIIIDKSSSCSGLEGATSVGFNTLIENERKKGFPTMVTTVLFSDIAETICYRENISKVEPLVYYADGWTALYDTMYDTINRIKESQKFDAIKPKRTVVAIMTDGDNALPHNRRSIHNEQEVRSLVKECQNNGWEFIFLGALNNAQNLAASLGIDFKNSVEVENTQVGMFNNFKTIETALDDIRTYGKLTDNWAKASKKNNNNSLESKDVKKLGLR